MHLHKIKHESILNGEPKLSTCITYCKIIIKSLIGRPLCKSFVSENSKQDLDVKPHCTLFSGSEPLNNNTQPNQVHTCEPNRKTWVDPDRKELRLKP